MEPPETTDLRRIPVLFLDLAVSQSDTITHTYISTEKTVKNVVDCGCDCSVRNTASSIHILDHLHELRERWEGMQGEQRPQSCSLCRRVQREGHSLPRGDGGWKPLSEGPGRVIPAVGFKGERTLPLWGL